MGRGKGVPAWARWCACVVRGGGLSLEKLIPAPVNWRQDPRDTTGLENCLGAGVPVCIEKGESCRAWETNADSFGEPGIGHGKEGDRGCLNQPSAACARGYCTRWVMTVPSG